MDVDFDPRTGSIRELITTGGRVVGDRLFGCGRYAAVVLAGSPWTRHANPMEGLTHEPGHPVLR